VAGEQPLVSRLRAVTAAKDERVTVLQARLGAALTRLDAGSPRVPRDGGVNASWRPLGQVRMPDLTDFQLEVTCLFSSLPASKGFLLAGGAALLAQHLTTRPTEDLDFFTAPDRGQVPAARDALEAATRDFADVRLLARRFGKDVLPANMPMNTGADVAEVDQREDDRRDQGRAVLGVPQAIGRPGQEQVVRIHDHSLASEDHTTEGHTSEHQRISGPPAR
jgi:hypothetical protein